MLLPPSPTLDRFWRTDVDDDENCDEGDGKAGPLRTRTTRLVENRDGGVITLLLDKGVTELLGCRTSQQEGTNELIKSCVRRDFSFRSTKHVNDHHKRTYRGPTAGVFFGIVEKHRRFLG
jgi:hypothetical protein